MAKNARDSGNEGRARVCARRAGGVIVAEYLSRTGIQHNRSNSLENIRILERSGRITAEAQAILSRLLMRVDAGYHLPDDIDLIQDAISLKKELYGDAN